MPRTKAGRKEEERCAAALLTLLAVAEEMDGGGDEPDNLAQARLFFEDLTVADGDPALQAGLAKRVRAGCDALRLGSCAAQPMVMSFLVVNVLRPCPQALAVTGLGDVMQDGKTVRLAQNLLVVWARSTTETRKLARRLQKPSARTESKVCPSGPMYMSSMYIVNTWHGPCCAPPTHILFLGVDILGQPEVAASIALVACRDIICAGGGTGNAEGMPEVRLHVWHGDFLLLHVRTRDKCLYIDTPDI